MSKLDLNQISKDIESAKKEIKEKEYNDNTEKSYSPELFKKEYKPNFLELQIEVTEHYDDGRKKTEILKNDKDQVIVERNYYRNKRYIEKIRYPDGFLFSTQVYNSDGTPGKVVGAKKRIVKEKKMVGFYTTKELDDKISEFDINHRSISKSDLINFCIQYTFDNSDEESIAKHISDYQDYLEKQGY